MSAGTEPTVVVDARGLRCPLPVIRLAQAALGKPAGTMIEVWATDPAARADIPAWCRMRDQELVGVRDGEPGEPAGGAHTAYLVRVVTPRPSGR